MTTNQYSVEKQSHVKHEELELSYKLLKSCYCDDFTIYESYSLFASVKNGSDYYDEKLMSDITSSNDTAFYLFALISKGAVTPLTLADVIEDLLAAL